MKKFAAILLLAVSGFVSSVYAEPKKLLVVTVTTGYRHGSIPVAEKVLGDLAKSSGDFTVDYVRQAEGGEVGKEVREKMTLENLKKFDGVIFANTTGDLPITDKDGFMQWLKSGKAFVGMHAATDTFHGYRPYIDMIGAEFSHHPAITEVTCLSVDTNHPACKSLPKEWPVTDEIYLFQSYDPKKVHLLLKLDKDPGSRQAGEFPISWSKEYGQGKVFYTELGHRDEVWMDPAYQKHLLGGIRWALGLEKATENPKPGK
jgi:type 1 glutamine amidotransferase